MDKIPQIGYIGNKGALFQADCFDLLSGLKDNSIDLVFTDPPFNLGKDYGNSDFTDNLEEDEYLKWCQMWLSELIRVLKPGGALTIYHWPKWLIELGAWLNSKPELKYRSLISLNMKSGFPIRGRLHPANYGILYYVKKGGTITFNVVRQKTPICRHCGKEVRDYGGYRKIFKKFEDKDGVPWVQISDFWEDTRPARQDKSRKLQINELPFHIPERVILMASKPDDVVLDIFAGGGSTFHAAQMHGRYWLGSELGDLEPTLSRFAALLGTKEHKIIPQKVQSCFKDGYIIKIMAQQRSVANIKTVTKMDLAAINGDAHSKSKVLF